MTPRRVLLMARTLDMGGCERDLAKIALGLDRSRFEPHVGCFFEGGFRWEELRAGGVPIACFPLRSYASPSALRCASRLWRYLRRERIELLHTFDGPTNLFAHPVAAAARTRARIASNLWFRCMVAPREHKAARVIDRLAHRVVVNSQAVEKHLIEDEGVPPAKIFLNYNGIDLTAFHPGPGLELEELRGAEMVIGTVCALRVEKRVDLLMEAFAKLRQLRSRIALLIVGSGAMAESLHRRRDELGLGSSCVFIPSQKDVAAWMRTMDIFVLSSFSESFPNAALEALACGRCVVAAKVGGVPEVVLEGQTGMLFESNNVDDLVRALSAAAADRELRERLGAAAAIHVRDRFSIGLALARLEGLYSGLLGI